MSNDDILINLNVALLKAINSAVKARINMCSACFRAIADMKKTFKCLNRTCKETHVVFKEDERCLKVQERIKLPSDPSRTGQKMEKQAYMNMFMEYLDKLQMTVAERKKKKKEIEFSGEYTCRKCKKNLLSSETYYLCDCKFAYHIKCTKQDDVPQESDSSENEQIEEEVESTVHAVEVESFDSDEEEEENELDLNSDEI